jgi:hypothetical protein
MQWSKRAKITRDPAPTGTGRGPDLNAETAETAEMMRRSGPVFSAISACSAVQIIKTCARKGSSASLGPMTCVEQELIVLRLILLNELA